MKIIVQRTKKAEVRVDNACVGKIGKGYVLLIGITTTDTKEIADKLIKKIVNLRIFEDSEGKMNLNLKQVGGEVLAISQFTLYGDTSRGNRPSFITAARPEIAEPLYNYIVEELSKEFNVQTGIFGAMMEVDFINEGPCTIILEQD